MFTVEQLLESGMKSLTILKIEHLLNLAQLAVAVEYTDCISAEG